MHAPRAIGMARGIVEERVPAPAPFTCFALVERARVGDDRVGPAAIDVISARAGSSENVARHARDASSDHATVTASPAEVTVTGPGLSSLVSSVIACAAARVGTRTMRG